jgi:hypothetical protein
VKASATLRRVPKSDWFFVGLFAFATFALHLLAIKGYGYFRDELYYIACGDHLALGYVDQPTLSILILKIVRTLLGDSRFAIRFLPALGGAAFIVLAGAMAKALGGRRGAMSLTAAAAFAVTGNFFQFHVYSMNFLDLLFWQALILILISILRTGRTKLWLLFGATAGIGFENKISVLFLLSGLAAGILFTRFRRELKSLYLWAGAAVAALLALPYILWNAARDWPTLEFMRTAARVKNAETTLPGFLGGQILYNNPLTVLLWLPGLIFFFFHREGRKYRLFGWMYLSLFLVFVLQNGKDYYLAGAYPVLFAGGALLVERWTDQAKRRWARGGLASLLAAGGLVFCPLTLPILPAPTTAGLYRALGIMPTQERQEVGVLPQHFADQFGWEEMTALFARLHRTLSAEERPKCWVYLRNYGEAAAVDFFGPKQGLPKASCAHNSYWFWGPPEWDGGVAIILGESRNVRESQDDLRRHFESVVLAGTTSAAYAMPYENDRPVFLCRRARFAIKDIWAGEKNFE